MYDTCGKDSFGVHLAFFHVASCQRCSHYEMPVSFFVSDTLCVRDSHFYALYSLSVLHTQFYAYFVGEIL